MSTLYSLPEAESALPFNDPGWVYQPPGCEQTVLRKDYMVIFIQNVRVFLLA